MVDIVDPLPSPIADVVWYPTVSAQGVLSWTKNNTTVTPAAVSIKGADGDATQAWCKSYIDEQFGALLNTTY